MKAHAPKKASIPKASIPRQILVAVDAEPSSVHAIGVGLELSQLLDARVEVVHAVGSAVEDPVAVSRGESIEMAARRAVVAEVRAVLADATQQRVGPTPVFGRTSATLARATAAK